MANPRIYVYLRKSTVDQNTKGQELAIRKYADEVTVEQAAEKMPFNGRDARFEGKNSKNRAVG